MRRLTLTFAAAALCAGLMAGSTAGAVTYDCSKPGNALSACAQRSITRSVDC